MAWEIDWARTRHGRWVWARKAGAARQKTRAWHWTSYTTLCRDGIAWTPEKRPGGWEVDWSRRRRVGTNAQVWARNVASDQSRARAWHWTTWQTLRVAGIPWPRVRGIKGRIVHEKGYVQIGRGVMTPEQIAMADLLNLWIGRTRKRWFRVWEHQLVAAMKYGGLPPGFLVRHRNGDKADNRPENLLLGTRKDNSKDHKDAVLEMMYWRQRALEAEGKNLVAELAR